MAYGLESPLKGENGDEKDNHLLGRGDHSPVEVQGVGRGAVDGGAGSPRGRGVPEAPPEKGGAAMRGDGSIFLRGKIWWIAYSFRGRPYQESSKSTDERAAKKLLRLRLKKVRP